MEDISRVVQEIRMALGEVCGEGAGLHTCPVCGIESVMLKVFVSVSDSHRGL